MISCKRDQETDEREVIQKFHGPITPIQPMVEAVSVEEKKYSPAELWAVTKRVTDEITTQGGELISVTMNCWGHARIAIKAESFEKIYNRVKPRIVADYAMYRTKIECVLVEANKYIGGNTNEDR